MFRFLTGTGYWTTYGTDRIPSVFLCDGPAGLRVQTGKTDYFGIYPSLPAQLYPCEAALACTWDRQLLEQVGFEMGREMHRLQADVLLGPAVDHKRSPLAGRTFEYFSEDPILSARLAAAQIRGIHRAGKFCCLKHLTCNSQEQNRMTIDVRIDEKPLHDIYLKAFREVIREEAPDAIMTAYNRLNGTFCTENKGLLDLVRSWGFDGMFISDWGSVNDPVHSFQAGLNLEMPGTKDTAEEVKKVLSAKEAERSVQKLIALAEKKQARQASEDVRTAIGNVRLPDPSIDLQAARESLVLVKQGHAIGLAKSLAVAGYGGKHPRLQAHGSSRVVPLYETNFVQTARKAGHEVYYARGTREDGTTSARLLEGMRAAVGCGDEVILFVSIPEEWESEGFDRNDLSLPEDTLRFLDQAVAAAGTKASTIVMQAGGPVRMDFLDQLPETANVWIQYLSGAEGGQALYDLLAGSYVPMGRLAETWPLNEADVPAHAWWHKSRKEAVYGEGVFTGYRYYASFHVPVRFPFGYGLSGTEFVFERIEKKRQAGNGSCISGTIRNAGAQSGLCVLQLYRGSLQADQPVLELEDWVRLFIEPGQSKTFSFAVTDGWHALGENVQDLVWTDRPDGIYAPVMPELPASGKPGGVPDWNITAGDLLEHPFWSWIVKGVQEGYLLSRPRHSRGRLREQISELSLRMLVLHGISRRKIRQFLKVIRATMSQTPKERGRYYGDESPSAFGR